MKKFLLFIVFSFAVYQVSLAQTDTEKPDTSTTKKTTLTLAAIYTSNASYYGQTADRRLPYILGNATFRLPSQLSFSISSYKLLDSTSGITATILGAGYDFKLAKNLSSSINYSHTFYASNSPLLQASNPDNASASISYAYWLTTGLTLDYAFGSQNDGFLTFSNSKQFNLGSFSDKDEITLEPTIEIVGGTQHFYETYTKEEQIRQKKLIGIIPTQPPQTKTTSTTTSTTKFNLLSYNFSLPLAYNRNNYVVQATYQLSILSNKVVATSKTPKSFFNLGFYYQF